jgi:hypothetical protein
MCDGAIRRCEDGDIMERGLMDVMESLALGVSGWRCGWTMWITMCDARRGRTMGWTMDDEWMMDDG